MTTDIKSLIAGLNPQELAEYTAAILAAESTEDVIAFVAEKGQRIDEETAQELIAQAKAASSEEISIDELDNVAGGCNDFPCKTYMC